MVNVNTLSELLWELKCEACHFGRFPNDRRSPFWFDTRRQWSRKNGFRPFRCIGYNQRVRQINALEDAIQALARK